MDEPTDEQLLSALAKAKPQWASDGLGLRGRSVGTQQPLLAPARGLPDRRGQPASLVLANLEDGFPQDEDGTGGSHGVDPCTPVNITVSLSGTATIEDCTEPTTFHEILTTNFSSANVTVGPPWHALIADGIMESPCPDQTFEPDTIEAEISIDCHPDNPTTHGGLYHVTVTPTAFGGGTILLVDVYADIGVPVANANGGTITLSLA